MMQYYFYLLRLLIHSIFVEADDFDPKLFATTSPPNKRSFTIDQRPLEAIYDQEKRRKKCWGEGNTF